MAMQGFYHVPDNILIDSYILIQLNLTTTYREVLLSLFYKGGN